MEELVECSGIARGWWVPAQDSERSCACLVNAIEDQKAAEALIQERRMRRANIDPRLIHDYVAPEVVGDYEAADA